MKNKSLKRILAFCAKDLVWKGGWIVWTWTWFWGKAGWTGSDVIMGKQHV